MGRSPWAGPARAALDRAAGEQRQRWFCRPLVPARAPASRRRVQSVFVRLARRPAALPRPALPARVLRLRPPAARRRGPAGPVGHLREPGDDGAVLVRCRAGGHTVTPALARAAPREAAHHAPGAVRGDGARLGRRRHGGGGLEAGGRLARGAVAPRRPGRVFELGSSGTTPDNMRGFRQLRRLRMDVRMFGGPRYDERRAVDSRRPDDEEPPGASGGQSEQALLPRLVDLLPPSIKQVTLCWYLDPRLPAARSRVVCRLFEGLREERARCLCLPQLKSVELRTVSEYSTYGSEVADTIRAVEEAGGGRELPV
ncbi:hypothetical protein VTK73DRAFT_7389 [Phialemonium thermophilum]|uniref:Uncharacterized protein n=1 Tax=Phialemonium thermophilum TaxID=223376 RepID=A0ABR3WEP4_9PEZI